MKEQQKYEQEVITLQGCYGGRRYDSSPEDIMIIRENWEILENNQKQNSQQMRFC